jgi:hypothetical protein
VYENIPGRPLEYASTILACLALVVTMPIYVFYKKGPEIRAKSNFAQSLDQTRQKSIANRRKSSVGVNGKQSRSEKQLNERV